MVDLAVQKSTLAGITPAHVAASVGGDTFTNTGQETVEVIATSNPVAVTVVAQGMCNHGVLHPQVVNVPAGQTRRIGPFRDLARWNDVDKKVHLTYDQVVGVTIGVFDEV